jgi:dephospho-CoA kinase
VTTLNVLDSDLIPKKSLVDKVASADRPLLILTIGVSTFIKRNPQWNYKLIVIQEDEGVIKDRMIGRNGAVTDTIKRRIKRMISLAKQAQFTGTSAEVLQYLNSI